MKKIRKVNVNLLIETLKQVRRDGVIHIDIKGFRRKGQDFLKIYAKK